MTVTMPQFVQEILKHMNTAGFEAYLVGGCVRDSILGRIPGDWDITTNALPHQVMELFPHCIPTGLQHGTVTVLWQDQFPVEITTYRTDGIYEDGRHPKQVSFSSTLEEDVSRRDFTMNAIAYSPATGIVDLFDGLSHIQQKKICCVGDPMLRFSEDALRMLRAIRFSAVLGFEIEPAILDAIDKLHETIEKVSIERIQEEFSKTLLSDHTQALQLLLSTGLLAHFLPEVSEIPYYTEFSRLPHILPCRLAVLLQGTDISEVQSILKRLRYSNAVCAQTVSILKNMDAGLPFSETAIRKRLADKWLQAGFADFLAIQQALTIDSDDSQQAQQIQQMHETILQRGDCTSLSTLAVNGRTLEEIGITDGHKKGTVLQSLLQAVLENPNLNTKEQLIDIALRIC